jgi:hypothetical protein
LCRTLGETASSSLPSAATGTKLGWTRCLFRIRCCLHWPPWFRSCR